MLNKTNSRPLLIYLLMVFISFLNFSATPLPADPAPCNAESDCGTPTLDEVVVEGEFEPTNYPGTTMAWFVNDYPAYGALPWAADRTQWQGTIYENTPLNINPGAERVLNLMNYASIKGGRKFGTNKERKDKLNFEMLFKKGENGFFMGNLGNLTAQVKGDKGQTDPDKPGVIYEPKEMKVSIGNHDGGALMTYTFEPRTSELKGITVSYGRDMDGNPKSNPTLNPVGYSWSIGVNPGNAIFSTGGTITVRDANGAPIATITGYANTFNGPVYDDGLTFPSDRTYGIIINANYDLW